MTTTDKDIYSDVVDILINHETQTNDSLFGFHFALALIRCKLETSTKQQHIHIMMILIAEITELFNDVNEIDVQIEDGLCGTEEI